MGKIPFRDQGTGFQLLLDLGEMFQYTDGLTTSMWSEGHKVKVCENKNQGGKCLLLCKIAGIPYCQHGNRPKRIKHIGLCGCWIDEREPYVRYGW